MTTRLRPRVLVMPLPRSRKRRTCSFFENCRCTVYSYVYRTYSCSLWNLPLNSRCVLAVYSCVWLRCLPRFVMSHCAVADGASPL